MLDFSLLLARAHARLPHRWHDAQTPEAMLALLPVCFLGDMARLLWVSLLAGIDEARHGTADAATWIVERYVHSVTRAWPAIRMRIRGLRPGQQAGGRQ